MRYPLPCFPLSDAPRQCIRRTTTDCHPYQSSHVGCRFCRSGSSGKGIGGATGGAGGGAQQKSGRVKTTLKALLLRAILLNAMAACSCWGMGSSERWMSEDLGFQTIL